MRRRHMTLQIGQEVRITNTKHVFGKITCLIEDECVVEIEPRKLRLRASDIEVLDEPQSKDEELILIESEKWLAIATVARLLEEWGGNPATDPIPEQIWILIRKAFSLK
jgi:hypothetical protein